jgi:hypothetical protein
VTAATISSSISKRIAHLAGGAEGAGNEQQGVAGEEEQHHEAGLAKHDREQDGIHIHTVLGQQGAQGLIDMQEHVE